MYSTILFKILHFMTILRFVIKYYISFLTVTRFIVFWDIGKIGGDTYFPFTNKFCLAKDNVCYILLIVLFLSCLSSLNATRSKFLCKESIATKIATLSQMSLFGITAALKQLQKNCIFKKTLVTNFSKLLSLLILGYIKSAWKIE